MKDKKADTSPSTSTATSPSDHEEEEFDLLTKMPNLEDYGEVSPGHFNCFGRWNQMKAVVACYTAAEL